MVKLAWCLVVVAIVGIVVALAAQPASAQEQGQTQMGQMQDQPAAAGEYPNVSGLGPFAGESNYMSLPGYLRWMVFREQKVWLSVPEAKRIVGEHTGG